ncbi:hypothetical protein ACGF3G_00705 [Streptomyces sp. NPDC048179]|uniref:hypothetical protein n=1 Tax=Streptomyces sp. NPDC048179 TaxID=3365506 RepID=UPI00372446E8
MPDVTCGAQCTTGHTYRLNECGLSCKEIHGGVADTSWTVGCRRCKVPAHRPCRRWDGTAASVSCGERWKRYDEEQKAAAEANRPKACPAGVHSIFDPCPGDCGKLLEEPAPERPAPYGYHVSITTTPKILGPEIMQNIRRILADSSRRASRRTDTDEERRVRRNRYAETIRNRIKELTWPAPYPGGAPRYGATEYDLADVVLDERDDELDRLRAELDRHRKAISAVTRYNTTVADFSTRVQAAEQARDTLAILREVMNAPERPPTAPEGIR